MSQIVKYKPCCDGRCGVYGCESKDQGACYCCCRLLDNIAAMQDIIDGKARFEGDCIIYGFPGLGCGHGTKTAKDRLERLQEKLKDYLVD